MEETPEVDEVQKGSPETGAVVRYFHALGTKVPTGKVIEHIGDDTLVYLVGKHVAAFQYDNPQHRFMLKGPKTAEVISFCVSPNRKYIALAERLLDGPLQVNIYTQHTGSKVRSLEFKYLSKLPVVSMEFSTDNKYLATVTALPDVYIYLWQVDKSRLVGMIDVPFEITKISVSPWSYWSLCTTGPSSLRLWRLVDKQLKQVDPIPKRKDGNASVSYRFTCHMWYDEEKLIAGTEEGDLVVVENSEVKHIIRAIHGEGYAITTLTAMSRGFICGGEGGIISLFERTFDDTTYFRSLKRFNPSVVHARVADVTVSPKEESAVIVYQNNSICSLSLENVDILRDSDSASFQQLSVGFHCDTVTAVDVCVQKPLIMTASADKTVRVWNFQKRRVEFTKTFDEEVLSLALHPTGLRVVLGFKSYMRMYSMLSQDLNFCTEFPVKPCYEVRFSNGGQYFAAAIAHRVLVFNTYDFQCTAQLGGHTVMIRSLTWSSNDQFLTTADLNGIVYSWEIDNQKRIDADVERKNASYSCVKFDNETGMIAAMGTNRVAEGGVAEGEVTIRCIVPDKEPRMVRPGVLTSKLPSQRKHHSCEMALSSLSQTLFVGSPNGQLLLYRFPLTEDAQPYQRYEAHDGEILFVILSVDEGYLFTIGEDNSMFMFDVESICAGRQLTKKPFNYATFDDVCYVLQSDVDDKVREIALLTHELDELQAAKTRDEANLIQKYEQERVTKEESLTTQISVLDRKLEEMTKLKVEAERTVVENTRQMESMHLKTAEELESLYTKRSEVANEKYRVLKTERDDLIVRYENKLYKIQKEHEAERKRLEDKAKEVEVKLGAEIENLKTRMTEEARIQEAMLDQTIADYETAIDDENGKNEQLLVKKEEDLNRAINISSTGERDADRLRKEKKELLTQLQSRDGRITELEQLNEKRRKDFESLKNEINVRCESISATEKKNLQLIKQTTELEKLRYVLTFKFNELKKEVAPKDKQISFLTQRVEEMDHELEKVAVDREQLKQSLEHKEDKLGVLQKEVQGQRRSVEDKERVINSILRELTELINTGDSKRLAYSLKDVLLRYNSEKQRNDIVIEEDRTAEFERQREYMEAQLTCVKRQNKQKESSLRLENQRNTSENAILVKEINELRHEKKLLTTKCQLVEAQLREARLALQRATSVAPQATSPQSKQDHEDEGDLSLPKKGKLIRGPTRALRDIAQLDSDKIARIIAQVERNNAEMERQQTEIVRLREFVSHLLSRADSAEENLSPDEKRRHDEIKRQLQASMTPVPTPT